MATIIRFPAEAAAWRAQNRDRDRGDGAARGEILIFTGIRYARQDGGMDSGNGSRPSRRKRRVKV